MSSPYTAWPAKRRPEVEKVLRESRTRAEAADKLGVTLSALGHATARYGLHPKDLLNTGRALPVIETAPPEPKPATDTPLEVPPPRIPSADGVERRLIMADLHMPVHSVPAVTCALQIARALQPHVIILNGDLGNMGAVSHFNDYAIDRETFEAATSAVRAFIRALRKITASRIYVLGGNHEKWAEDAIVANPRLAGSTLSVPIAYGLEHRPDPEDRGSVIPDATWHPEQSQPIVLGPVAYMHGTAGGEHFEIGRASCRERV